MRSCDAKVKFTSCVDWHKKVTTLFMFHYKMVFPKSLKSRNSGSKEYMLACQTEKLAGDVSFVQNVNQVATNSFAHALTRLHVARMSWNPQLGSQALARTAITWFGAFRVASLWWKSSDESQGPSKKLEAEPMWVCALVFLCQARAPSKNTPMMLPSRAGGRQNPGSSGPKRFRFPATKGP